MTIMPAPFRGGLVAALVVFVTLPLSAEKIWNSPTDGFWRDGTNWSGAAAPDVTSFIEITNANSKTVTIDALTDPTNLTVQKLTINALPGSTNLLLLNSVGVTNPLVFQTGLEMQDGAAIHITNSAVLLQLTNDHVNIDGTLTLDSGLLDFGDVTVTARVGRVTSGILNINGGSVNAGTVYVGGLTNSSGALNMNGGVLTVGSLLSVGRELSTVGTMTLTGGQLTVSNDDTRIGDSGTGELVISNATAAVTNIAVGRDALSSGTFWIEAGAQVMASGDLSIARFMGSTGAVFVAGGQFDGTGQKIYVGREGLGSLTILSGTVRSATVLVAADNTNTSAGTFELDGGLSICASNFYVGSAGVSAGQAVATGGTLEVTNSAGTAILNVVSGGFAVSGGVVSADSIQVTNSSGIFLLSGGTVMSRGTVIGNGSAFVVGDGTNPATFYLNGGTHTFANGLVISSNATLAGCGTIVGSIVNHGIIATNCNPTLVRPVITGYQRIGTTNVISFSSVVGQSYTLEFNGGTAAGTWSSAAGPTNGTGGTIALQDTAAASAGRFYRVHTQ